MSGILYTIAVIAGALLLFAIVAALFKSKARSVEDPSGGGASPLPGARGARMDTQSVLKGAEGGDVDVDEQV